MTFLKNRQASGQAVVESILGGCFMIIILVTAFILMVHVFTSLILSKWAGQHSLCLAENPQFICEKQTRYELQNFFALKSVKIHSRVIRGTIHSEIEARLIDHSSLRARYDLVSSEYKRVSQ